MSVEPCPCRQVAPYSHTHDLERELEPPVEGALRLLERTHDLTIRCRACGTAWLGDPLPGGGIYGDTLWTRLCDDGAQLVEHARRFAVEAHGDQRYGDAPYVVHLDAVVAVLRELGHERTEVLCAGYLHDVVEDTETRVPAVCTSFGHDVGELVAFCTDEDGPNRKVRKSKTYARMKADIASGTELAVRAAAVKLADRIANVRQCQAAGNHGLLAMYRTEQAALRDALQRPGEHEAEWRALEAALGE